MKKAKKVLSLVSGILLLCSITFTGCGNPANGTEGETDGTEQTTDTTKTDDTAATDDTTKTDDTTTDDSTTESVTPSITFNEATDALSVTIGEDGITLTVKESAGTWKVDTDNVPDSLDVTTEAEDGKLTSITIKASEVAAEGDAEITLYPEEDDSGDSDVTLKVSVVDPKFTFKITLADEIAEQAASITVTYEKEPAIDAVVEYTAGEKTAKVTFLKENADDWKWFNEIVITVLDADGNALKTKVNGNNYFQYSDETFTGLSVVAKEAEKMTVTLTFDDFYADSVAVTYGNSDDDTTVNSADGDVVIAADKKSATVALSNDYENASGYIAVLSVTVTGTTDASSEAKDLNVEFKGTSNYVEFDSSNTEASFEYALASEWTSLLDADAAGAGSFAQVLTAEDFKDSDGNSLVINTLRVVAANVENEWWANCSYANDWDIDIDMKADGQWSDTYKGYMYDITDSDYIASILLNGLYMAGGYTHVYVMYN